MSTVTLMSKVSKVLNISIKVQSEQSYSHVKGVKSGVCGFYADAYRHIVYCIMPLVPPRGKAPCC